MCSSSICAPVAEAIGSGSPEGPAVRRCGCLRRWVGRSGALGPSARRQQGVSSRARRSCELCAQAPPGLFMPPRARGRPLGERGSHWPRRPLAPAPRLPAPPRQAGEDPPPALAAGVTNARFPARGPIQPAGPATLPRSSAEPGGAGAGSRGPETGCRAAPPPKGKEEAPPSGSQGQIPPLTALSPYWGWGGAGLCSPGSPLALPCPCPVGFSECSATDEP